MAIWSWWVISVFLVGTFVLSNARTYFDEQHHKLPEFTQLDDYERCLSMKNALYCFGTFRLHSNGSSSEEYDLIQKYSEPIHHFDRTFIHRGYCLSTRCPFQSEENERDSFEKCVQDSQKGLNASLHTISFCQTKKNSISLDIQSSIFLVVITIVLVLNIFGTVVDIKNDGTKKMFWSSWSIRSSWQQLVGPFGDDPEIVALAPIQGIRVFLMAFIIMIHVFTVYAGAYLYNPDRLEQFLSSATKVWSVKLVSVVQIFFALSSFLTTLNLLLNSSKQQLSLELLPKQMMKRYFRIAPVHLLFISFGATLWPLISDGPMWRPKIHIEKEICRKKFWAHFLHLNNFVADWELCLPQSWSLAADIQFQMVSIILTVLLAQYNSKLKILTILLISSSLLNFSLASMYDWKPFLLMITGKTAVNLGRDQLVSFASYYYVAPWGSLPSCLIGLILAHIYLKWRQDGNKLDDYKWLSLLCRLSLPLLLLWIAVGHFTQDIESPVLLAAYVAIERPVFSGLASIWIFGVITGKDSAIKNMLSWRGWLPLGRLSLSVLMVHWVIIESDIFSGLQPVYISYFNIVKEFLSTLCLSYLLAIPITLLVELPVINTFNYVSAKNINTEANSTPKKIM